VLKDVGRKKREKKTVKSDDAAVSEYLWEDHLIAGSSVGEWNAKAIDNLCMISNWLRERMLCWWKRKVVSSYVSWMKAKYDIKDPKTGEDTDCVQLEGDVHDATNPAQDRYVWNKEGRQAYK
jgi:hypothetical protein